MSPVLKIMVGALMMVLGIFTSLRFSTQLIELVLGGIGPLLVLVGAFIVWLESDEWKMQREEKNQEETQISGQQTLQTGQTAEKSDDMEGETREAAREIKQAVSGSSGRKEKAGPEELVVNRTVDEVKQAINDRDDLDIREVLQAEKNSQNRKTLVDYLERQLG